MAFTPHRYFRLVGVSVQGTGPLELTEARLYEAGVLADTGATLTAAIAPDTGSVAQLVDDDTGDLVVWSNAKVRAPGWALMWDFGSGNDLIISHLRLGAGSSAETFPYTCLFQSSDDNATWKTEKTIYGVTYPGPETLTEEPTPGLGDLVDDLDAFVTSKINGTDDLLDDKGNTTTAYGDTQVNDSVLGEPAIQLDGAGDRMDIDGTGGKFTPGAGAFCMECWISAAPTNNNYNIPIDTCGNGSGFNGMLLEYSTIRGLGWLEQNPSSRSLAYPAAPLDNVERHVFVSRTAAGQLRLGFDSVIRDGIVDTQTIPNNPGKMTFGNYTSPDGGSYFKGTIRGFKFTKGEHRYTGDIGDEYTPTPIPGTTYAVAFLPIDTVRPDRWRTSVKGIDLEPGDVFDETRAQQVGATVVNFVDVYDGGQGIVYGTVKEKHSPDNTPLRRRVLLINERSRAIIRSTFSDAVTGEFEFRGVAKGVPYSTVAYDHLHNYRAVIADNLQAGDPS